MLVGAKIEFKVVDSFERYLDGGSLIEDNEKYSCIADGEGYYVVFKFWTNNQILTIYPDFAQNLDPDGGTTFMQENVKQLINSFLTEATYI